mmetsp:Transcript_18014/g.27905  ORF Transcript_18014/g.27905 Transcript_18014/m.27905 type:complete len:1057 (+) Transcript_18014:13-3183(+)
MESTVSQTHRIKESGLVQLHVLLELGQELGVAVGGRGVSLDVLGLSRLVRLVRNLLVDLRELVLRLEHGSLLGGGGLGEGGGLLDGHLGGSLHADILLGRLIQTELLLLGLDDTGAKHALVVEDLLAADTPLSILHLELVAHGGASDVELVLGVLGQSNELGHVLQEVVLEGLVRLAVLVPLLASVHRLDLRRSEGLLEASHVGDVALQGAEVLHHLVLEVVHGGLAADVAVGALLEFTSELGVERLPRGELGLDRDEVLLQSGLGVLETLVLHLEDSVLLLGLGGLGLLVDALGSLEGVLQVLLGVGELVRLAFEVVLARLEVAFEGLDLGLGLGQLVRDRGLLSVDLHEAVRQLVDLVRAGIHGGLGLAELLLSVDAVVMLGLELDLKLLDFALQLDLGLGELLLGRVQLLELSLEFCGVLVGRLQRGLELGDRGDGVLELGGGDLKVVRDGGLLLDELLLLDGEGLDLLGEDDNLLLLVLHGLGELGELLLEVLLLILELGHFLVELLARLDEVLADVHQVGGLVDLLGKLHLDLSEIRGDARAGLGLHRVRVDAVGVIDLGDLELRLARLGALLALGDLVGLLLAVLLRLSEGGVAALDLRLDLGHDRLGLGLDSDNLLLVLLDDDLLVGALGGLSKLGAVVLARLEMLGKLLDGLLVALSGLEGGSLALLAELGHIEVASLELLVDGGHLLEVLDELGLLESELLVVGGTLVAKLDLDVQLLDVVVDLGDLSLELSALGSLLGLGEGLLDRLDLGLQGGGVRVARGDFLGKLLDLLLVLLDLSLEVGKLLNLDSEVALLADALLKLLGALVVLAVDLLTLLELALIFQLLGLEIGHLLKACLVELVLGLEPGRAVRDGHVLHLDTDHLQDGENLRPLRLAANARGFGDGELVLDLLDVALLDGVLLLVDLPLGGDGVGADGLGETLLEGAEELQDLVVLEVGGTDGGHDVGQNTSHLAGSVLLEVLDLGLGGRDLGAGGRRAAVHGRKDHLLDLGDRRGLALQLGLGERALLLDLLDRLLIASDLQLTACDLGLVLRDFIRAVLLLDGHGF